MSIKARPINDRPESEFVEIGQPKRFDVLTIDMLDDAVAQEGHERFYAIARVDGVQIRDPDDPTAIDDACHVLFMDADADRAVERRYLNVAGEWDGIKSSVMVDPDNDSIGRPTENVRAWARPVLERHGLEDR